ncbi:hypothetical protein CPT03_14510 [Pedobacter ginsengisoli]|uniref:TonB-dependent receptor n=2 Tax=Pedobacter ginsengisoli TaxID=363852 RepID=A0A2D1U7M2_9SPHI|nr:hypothetical protein CPT03_14510 [Pedobacter ginsengisoli]
MLLLNFYLRIFLITLFTSFNCSMVFSQQSTMEITGKVIDAQSNQPLSGATVYLDHTTKATISSDSGSFVLKNIPSGNYKLIVSYIGYNSAFADLSENNIPNLIVELTPGVKLLDEVAITANPNWQEYFLLFKMFFLGKGGQYCTIKNPKTLSFDHNDTSYVLTAQAGKPLIIENQALGYRIYYELNSFVHYAGRTSYSGYTRFEEMTAANSKEQKKWKSNREKAYLGSSVHFMRSLVNKTSKEEGFVMKKLVKANLRKSEENEFKSTDTIVTMQWNGRNYFAKDTTVLSGAGSLISRSKVGYDLLYPEELPYDSVVTANLNGNYKLSFNNSLFVIYKKKKNVTSILTMLTPETFVDTHGNLANPQAVLHEGYWATLRIADQLPFDYLPDKD